VEPIPLMDLARQDAPLREAIRAAIDRVVESGRFVLGEEVERFEREMAGYVGVAHAVGVGSGLDALRLALEALGIGPGDEVIVPANTYVSTALAVSALGARPVLVDALEDTGLIDPALAERAVTARTRAIVPVHLYGQAADMDRLGALARAHGLAVVEDAAQAHGARFRGRSCGSLGRAGCFSFYPSKNLGAYGDGGMVVTDDAELAERVRWLRNVGQPRKNEHAIRGVNSRLDAIQAAVLSVKLPHLDEWNGRRAVHARRYAALLAGSSVTALGLDPRCAHVFHLYVVRSGRRDALRALLEAHGVETGIHYPAPVHLLAAYRDLGHGPGAFPVAERLAREVLSLPMSAGLSAEHVERVAAAVRRFSRPERDG
jgi:dTDP-4-amino-4,6-dideoxygalactose transaminase